MSVASVQLFYLLGRDHLPLGVIESIFCNHLEKASGQVVVYSNTHLERWARECADRLDALALFPDPPAVPSRESRDTA